VAAARLGPLAFAAALALGCGEPVRRYPAHGLVVDVSRDTQQVVVDHEDIPGLMTAMTMGFDCDDRELLDLLAPGQVIDFEVAFDGHSYRIASAVVRSQRPPPRDGPTLGGVVDLGQRAPEFALTDQHARPLSSQDLHGHLVLVDFIYTKCPGPCPIVTGVHAEVARRLSPALRERLRLVSITLDPARDTPEALRAYATARGAAVPGWSFVTGPREAIDAVLQGYGVGRAPGEDGEIDHLVVTFLLDEQGRVARRWIGLDHHADAILADLERFAGG